MAIPGYDPDDIDEALLEREGDSEEHEGDSEEHEGDSEEHEGDSEGHEADAAGTNARVSVAAADVPDHFVVTESETESPSNALSEPVDVRGLEEINGLEAIRIELAYEPSKLPPGASPTDVAVAAVTGDGPRPFESDVDLEETTVSAVMSERPPATTLVAVAVVDDG